MRLIRSDFQTFCVYVILLRKGVAAAVGKFFCTKMQGCKQDS